MEASLPPSADLSFTLITTRDLDKVLPGQALREFTDTSADNEMQIFVTPSRDMMNLLE